MILMAEKGYPIASRSARFCKVKKQKIVPFFHSTQKTNRPFTVRYCECTTQKPYELFLDIEWIFKITSHANGNKQTENVSNRKSSNTPTDRVWVLICFCFERTSLATKIRLIFNLIILAIMERPKLFIGNIQLY